MVKLWEKRTPRLASILLFCILAGKALAWTWQHRGFYWVQGKSRAMLTFGREVAERGVISNVLQAWTCPSLQPFPAPQADTAHPPVSILIDLVVLNPRPPPLPVLRLPLCLSRTKSLPLSRTKSLPIPSPLKRKLNPLSARGEENCKYMKQ